MRLLYLVSFAVGISATAIQSRDPHDDIDWSQFQWQAPGEGDMRGPCPGLNTLANHGILPRNGSNITIEAVLQAGIDGYNVQNDALQLAAKVSLLTSPLDSQFSLNDIKLHGNIEHDASISRVDHYLGDNVPFNETIFSTLANSTPEVDFYNGTIAGLAYKARLADSIANNDKLMNTVKEHAIRLREGGLFLSVMGDPTTGIAPKEFVNIFFREERLPIEEGWKRGVPITSDTLRPIQNEIAAVDGFVADPNDFPWLVLGPGSSEDPYRDGTIGTPKNST